MSFPIRIDVLIIGGGIAGLWLLDDLLGRNYSALLVESKALGTGQTVASQGILHSGFKHSAVGRKDAFVNNLRSMLSLWRECLDGMRQPDLHLVARRSEYCCVWRTDTIASYMGQLGARLGLQGGMEIVARENIPLPLANRDGVFRLKEQVIDPASLVSVLAMRNRKRIIQADVRIADHSAGKTAVITSPDKMRACEFKPEMTVLTAGEGNSALREAFGLSGKLMAHLPLRILTLRGDLPDLNGFCIEKMHAKVVVTTQRISRQEAVWQVATESAHPDDPADFEPFAMNELRNALPGFDWPAVAIGSYCANRAEPLIKDKRPSDVYASVEGNVITAWPTKLVLAPRLAEQIYARLPPPSVQADFADLAGWPFPPIANFPWD